MSRFSISELDTFYEKADPHDRALMQTLLSTVSDWYQQYMEVRTKLDDAELSDQEKSMVETSLINSESPARSCLISIFYLADKYGIKVFNCNPEKQENLKPCCAEICEYLTK